MVNREFNSYNKTSSNPCFQCTDRKVGCHSTCSKYIEYVEENQKRKEAISKSKIADAVAKTYNKSKHAQSQQKIRENYRKERHTR